MRAVLSALSKKVPIRAKLKISFLSIVPCSEPRTYATRSLIRCRTAGRSRSETFRLSACDISIHASFTASQTSRVSAVRTIRALLRADSIETKTLDGFVLSRNNQSVADVRLISDEYAS